MYPYNTYLDRECLFVFNFTGPGGPLGKYGTHASKNVYFPVF